MLKKDGVCKYEASIGVLLRQPNSILNNLKVIGNPNINLNEKIEVVIISGESVDKLVDFVDKLGGTYEDLGYGYGVVNITLDKVSDLIKSDLIQYAELPKTLYTTDAASNRASCVQRAQSGFNIKGNGVLVGFIDSGIDYTHPAFRLENGDTRIEYIYDLSESGRVYTKSEINEALRSSNPNSIVSSTDITEHGTHVAGIACAGGKINPEYYGVAPESSIAMVKVTRGNFAISTDTMRGLKFLVDRSKELNMPLVVNISLSTNNGAHNGSSLLEQYIQTVSDLERVTICIAAGNEGDAAHHVGGMLISNEDIPFNIASDEATVILNIYKSLLPEISIELVSSTGTSTGEIQIREGYRDGSIGRDRYSVFYTGPKPFDKNGEILISINPSTNEYITEGNWRLIIRKVDQYEGEYDIWLPISEGLNIKTKFLKPVVENTLGIPATVQGIISVGSYNYLTNVVSSYSGRGKVANIEILKPDLVAPGEGITAPIPMGSYDVKTGTSMACPHVTGIAALMMEWGIIKKNDSYLYGERLKYYLVRGAKRNRPDISYPDISWGYGEICAYDSIDAVINSQRVSLRQQEGENPNQVNVPQTTVTGEINQGQGTQAQGNQQSNVSNTQSQNVNFTSQETDNKDIVGVIVEYDTERELNAIRALLNTVVYPLTTNFAIVYTPINQIDNVSKYTKNVITNNIPIIYTLNQLSPIEASQSVAFTNNPYLTLNGSGVLVGIMDTGIDYLNEEFMYSNNTSRIRAIWDQTIEGEGGLENFKFGSEYLQADINRAIVASKNGEDPYAIVPSIDTNGHGTRMASIISARGANPDVRGVLPESNLVIVKLREATRDLLEYSNVGKVKENTSYYQSTSLMLALIYLFKFADTSKQPMVVYIPLGTNIGAHDGTSALEGLAEGFGRSKGFVVVTGTGNEGDSDTHTEGRFLQPGEIRDIELRVGQGQGNLSLVIYIQQPDKVSISVISPSGEIIEKIPIKETNPVERKFTFEGTTMRIQYYIPDEQTGDELIVISSSKIREGVWKFRLTGEYIVDGRYWAWLPQRYLLADNTRFLNPSPYTTLMIPATGRSIISASYYNQNTNAVIGDAGRGFTRDGRIKPDIAAGGVSQQVTQPGGRVGTISGSSVGGAVVSGCVGMLLQWGIVNGNDPDLYTRKVRSYIINGAGMRDGDIYPNQEWGYGYIQMTKVFDAIRGVLTGGVKNISDVSTRGNDDYDEYMVGNLFIRKPNGV